MSQLYDLYNVVDFTKFLSSSGVNQNNRVTYISAMNNFYKYLLNVKSADKDLDYDLIDIFEFIKERQLIGRSRGTLHKCVLSINAYSSFVNKNLNIEFRDIPLLVDDQFPKKEFVILKKEAQINLYKYAQMTWKKRDISILLLMLETGIKISEIIALEKRDLFQRGDKCYIRIRSNFSRIVPISRILHDHIIHSYLSRVENESAMFITQHGFRVKEMSLQHIRKNFGLSLPILRDTYIYNHLMSIINEKGIKEDYIRNIYGDHSLRFKDLDL